MVSVSSVMVSTISSSIGPPPPAPYAQRACLFVLLPETGLEDPQRHPCPGQGLVDPALPVGLAADRLALLHGGGQWPGGSCPRPGQPFSLKSCSWGNLLLKFTSFLQFLCLRHLQLHGRLDQPVQLRHDLLVQRPLLGEITPSSAMVSNSRSRRFSANWITRLISRMEALGRSSTSISGMTLTSPGRNAVVLVSQVEGVVDHAHSVHTPAGGSRLWIHRP